MSQPAAATAPRERAPRGTPVGPCLMVIYGASGDLTRRKLVPALYNLALDGFLPEEFAVVGMARSPMTDEEFRARLDDDLRRLGHEGGERPLEAEVWQRLRARLHYHAGDFSDPQAFAALGRTLERVDREHGTGGNLLHYLAVAPSLFCPVVSHLGAAGLVREEGERWRRVIVEKPFGHDLESARALNRALRQVLAEEQIYRIDHYLGKETVQNILVLRFGNGLFEPVWNRRYIDHVQMTVAETVGVEGRGGYYEGAGALRDMVPNHLMQVLSLVAMEPPTSFEAEAVREEKAKLLRAIKLFSEEDVLTQAVRGQYGPSQAGDAPGYRQEERVDPRSSTETYAALKLSIDNWRWAGVPVYVRTGKRLARRVSEIAIFFRRPPFLLFRDTPIHHLAPNQLIIRIQPEEGIAFHFNAKVPGQKLELGDVAMDFRYDGYFGERPSTGYETLLHDAMRGDGTLFQRADMVEAGWSLVEPVLDVWRALPARTFPNYAANTWGPREADDLLARDDRTWRRPG